MGNPAEGSPVKPQSRVCVLLLLFCCSVCCGKLWRAVHEDMQAQREDRSSQLKYWQGNV